jgi:hypothetical protein
MESLEKLLYLSASETLLKYFKHVGLQQQNKILQVKSELIKQKLHEFYYGVNKGQ